MSIEIALGNKKIHISKYILEHYPDISDVIKNLQNSTVSQSKKITCNESPNYMQDVSISQDLSPTYDSTDSNDGNDGSSIMSCKNMTSTMNPRFRRMVSSIRQSN